MIGATRRARAADADRTSRSPARTRRRREQRSVVERTTDDLQAERQPVVEAARQRERRRAGDAGERAHAWRRPLLRGADAAMTAELRRRPRAGRDERVVTFVQRRHLGDQTSTLALRREIVGAREQRRGERPSEEMAAVVRRVMPQVLLMPREELRFGEHHAHRIEIVQRAHAHVLDPRTERTQHVERRVDRRHEGRDAAACPR